MRLAALLLLFLATAPLAAQDATAPGSIDEAFRLAGVRNLLETLPTHVNEMTAVAVSQLPQEQRRQFEPMIKEVSAKFLAPEAFYRQLKTSFSKYSDDTHMSTFLVLERTPVYRTMRRLEEAADAVTALAARRRFEANLKSDPPDAKRVDVLQRLDAARNATGLQMRILVTVMNAMAQGLGAQMPPDLQAQSEAFSKKVRPLLATNTLHEYLYTYRNTDAQDLEDYVRAEEQKDVQWFNRNLQAAIVAVAADRSAKAGEAIKTRSSQPFN